MENKLAKHEESNLVAMPGQSSVPALLSEQRIELLSKTIANGAPPLEFEMFIAICNRTRLDPFARQIGFIKRGDKWMAQTFIDGFRTVADRTGCYAGSDDPVYDTEAEDHPNKATVTVWKIVDGQRVPFTASARWKEYLPAEKQAHMWRKMPYLMLGKCAEALALRKAFPQDLSGLYTDDEMAQAGEHDVRMIEHAAQQLSGGDRQAMMRRLFAIAKQRNLSNDDIHALAFEAYRVESLKDLSDQQIKHLADRFEAAKDEALADVIANHRKRVATPPEPTENTIEVQGTVVADPETGEILPTDDDPNSPIPDFLARIAAAKSQAELTKISAELQETGLAGEKALKEAGIARWHELEPKKKAPVFGETQPAGEPGNNQYTN